MAVSTFFGFAILIIFAENILGPLRPMGRARPATNVGGLMRRAEESKRKRRKSRIRMRSEVRLNVPYLNDFRCVPFNRLAGSGLANEGMRRRSTSTKPVAQASRRTGVAQRRRVFAPAVEGWALWITGLWREIQRATGGNHA